jgi:glycosyltransferase involved in cell wall biosynthesis
MILVAGYPYIREVFLNTFESVRDDIVFLLPRIWKAKKGKVIFRPPKKPNVITTSAFFYHSHYPILGGVLKGWMPAFPFILRRLKKVTTVYTPLEPILLSALYQSFFSKVLGKKHFLFTWENVPYSKYRGLNGFSKRLILWANLSLSDGIICGNKKSEEIIRQHTNKPTTVIPLSGVDSEFFNPEKVQSKFREKHHISNSKIVFSFVGALGYRKGVHLILEALKSLDPNFHLIIAGSGEYENEIKNKIAELGLEVTMVPWADPLEIRDILAGTDVFLYPSIPHGGWEEQFGYSIAEAMSMKVPVITTSSGSIPDLINDQKDGIIIAANDVVALQKAMEKLGHNPQLRGEYGAAGRNKIIQQYSYQEIARRYMSFLNSHGS